jgi:hypothetical protein
MTSFEHYLLFGFVLVTLLSAIMRTVKHGLAGMSAILAFAVVVLCMLMFRFTVGTYAPSNAHFAIYIKTYIPIMIALAWGVTFVP